MSFEQFLIELLSYEKDEHLRRGQHYFVELYKVRPDIISKISGTKDDPFSVDGRIGRFFLKVKELW